MFILKFSSCVDTPKTHFFNILLHSTAGAKDGDVCSLLLAPSIQCSAEFFGDFFNSFKVLPPILLSIHTYMFRRVFVQVFEMMR